MVKNFNTLARRVSRWSPAIKARLAPKVLEEANELAEAVKRAAPVDETSDNPGKLRDSVHVEPGRRELSHVVVIDAKDDQGRVIALNVEAGHRAADGSHVPAHPFARPTYRARKKGMRRRLRADAQAAIKEIADGS